MKLIRSDWTTNKENKFKLDLSRNCHYDKILNLHIRDILKNINEITSTPNEYLLYKSISDYYTIPIKNMSIGFGATDLIHRILSSLKFKKLYFVAPTFEMIEIYCKVLSVDYVKVSLEELYNIEDKDSMVYIANPNGLTGEVIDSRFLVDKFKYCVLDEVYADFSDQHSLLHERHKNLIILKSLSKSLGATGLRVGFAVANDDMTIHLQNHRLNYITSTLSALIVPKIINLTPNVILRMKETKKYLEQKYDLMPSHGNYVLFKSANEYTKKFNYRDVNGLYRMALTDMETLNEGSL